MTPRFVFKPLGYVIIIKDMFTVQVNFIIIIHIAQRNKVPDTAAASVICVICVTLLSCDSLHHRHEYVHKKTYNQQSAQVC